SSNRSRWGHGSTRSRRLLPDKPSRLVLEAGEGARGHDLDVRLEPQSVADRLGDAGGEGSPPLIGRASEIRSDRRLQFDHQPGEMARLYHHDAILRNLAETPQKRLDRRRIDVVSADEHHVVDAAEDPALEHSRARIDVLLFLAVEADPAHEIAGAVADDRASDAPEVRDHELPELSRLDRLHAARREDLHD